MGPKILVAETGRDGRREQGQAAERRRDPKVDSVVAPEPPVQERRLRIVPPVRLVQPLAKLDVEAAQGECPLFHREPADGLGEIWQKEEHEERREASRYTFDDE